MNPDEIIITKKSETEIVISRPIETAPIEDIMTKDDVLARIEYLKNAIKSTQDVLTERIESFNKEKSELEYVLNQANVHGIMTEKEKQDLEEYTKAKSEGRV